MRAEGTGQGYPCSVLNLSFKRHKTMTMNIFVDQSDHKDSESVLELVSKCCFIEWLNVLSDSLS